jgi:tetratricopeptide (TPR) repeat protein
MMTRFMTSEGTESTRMLELQAWLEVNKKRVAIGIVAVAVVAAGVAIQGWMTRESERTASSALLQLQLSESSAPGGTVPASAFQQLAADHAGTAAAARSHLLAGEVLYQDGHYAEARTEFERASSLLKDDSLKAVAAFGRAVSLEALGQTAEALQAYQDVTLRHPTSSTAGQARLAMAGLLERTGEPKQALEVLRELSGLIDSAWSGAAKSREESLLQRHPELAPTPPEPGAEPDAPAVPTETPTIEPGAAGAEPEAPAVPMETPTIEPGAAGAEPEAPATDASAPNP